MKWVLAIAFVLASVALSAFLVIGIVQDAKAIKRRKAQLKESKIEERKS